MATSPYFCTSCGEPQPEIGQFCTSCGMPIDTSAAGAVVPAGPRPGATVRLPESTVGSALLNATVAVPAGAAPPTVPTPKPTPARAAGSRGGIAGRLTLARLVIGAALLALLVIVVVLARGLPFGRSKGIDRIVTLARSSTGDITLVLMHSDGSNKVTLVDAPSALAADSPPGLRFSVTHSLDEQLSQQARSGGDQGATILTRSGRILFWFLAADGIEIRSVDLDGGDLVKLRQASPADWMSIPASGDKLLLRETEQNSSRLLLVDLQGQKTTIVPEAAEIYGVISPDGKHIAYWQRVEQGRFTLAVADEHGANPVEVAREMQQVSADFSADSSKLFITRTDEQGMTFQVANADGQNPVTLSQAVSDGRQASGRGEVANGRLIYQVRNSDETSLFTSDLNGDDRVEIMRGAESMFWNLTPDRKQIIFLSKRNGRFALQATDLKHEQVQDLKRGESWIYWSFLENDRVLVQRSSADGNSTTFSTMRLDGSDEQILKRDLNSSRVNVDGNVIVLAGLQASGQASLTLFDGNDPVTLDEEANNYANARITPNGRVIYTAYFRSSTATYTVDRTGKNKKLLFEDAAIVATGF
jgi:hypothetical protein